MPYVIEYHIGACHKEQPVQRHENQTEDVKSEGSTDKNHTDDLQKQKTLISVYIILSSWVGGRGHISHQGALTRPWQWKVVYTLPKKSQHGHRYSSLNSRMKSASSTRVHININFRKVYALEIQTKNKKTTH